MPPVRSASYALVWPPNSRRRAQCGTWMSRHFVCSRRSLPFWSVQTEGSHIGLTDKPRERHARRTIVGKSSLIPVDFVVNHTQHHLSINELVGRQLVCIAHSVAKGAKSCAHMQTCSLRRNRGVNEIAHLKRATFRDKKITERIQNHCYTPSNVLSQY